MHRNLVLCADGTCNAFGHSSSNVARLLEHIELQQPAAQVVCYDQGIGTRRSEQARIRSFKDRLGPGCALHVLDAPGDAWTRPWTWPFLVASMTAGLGLKTNVGQLYVKLASLYELGDRVFLFGFSRGAFTVRALAGLTWRYGLPASKNADEIRARFSEAWPLFSNEFPDETGVNKAKAADFRSKYAQRSCRIHFLGLWDTVKSYGGLRPVMLPHLRHNPSVATVRHAMALDERRAWFEVTTWGWLDSDRKPDAAASRLEETDRRLIADQDVAEVWFSGCHSDVGGGGSTDGSSSIALRWMLGEASQAHLKLNSNGRAFLAVPPDRERPQGTNSRTWLWRVIDRIDRKAIDNEGKWPRHVPAKPGPSPREPLKSVRKDTLWHHESVQDLSRLGEIPSGLKLRPYPTTRTPPEE